MEKNLHSKEAVEKLKELLGAIGTCMFITSENAAAHSSRPMALIEVDDHANTWFFTSINSVKVKDIEADPNVAMIFTHPGKEIYVDVKGRATVVTDKEVLKDKWNPIVKAWFPEGPENSADLCLLKVKTDEAHYWDSENGKLMQSIKLLASVVTGQTLVKGVHGELTV